MNPFDTIFFLAAAFASQYFASVCVKERKWDAAVGWAGNFFITLTFLLLLKK